MIPLMAATDGSMYSVIPTSDSIVGRSPNLPCKSPKRPVSPSNEKQDEMADRSTTGAEVVAVASDAVCWTSADASTISVELD